MKSKLPLVVAFVLVFAFALMLVAFRSIVVAMKAIVLNLLSVAAAYGDPRAGLPARRRQGPARLQLDRGHLARRAAAAVRDPVRALDGLPRVHRQPDPRDVRSRREHGRGDLARDQVDRRSRHERSDRHGRVFSVFATLSMLFFKQFGVGLAAAILIDATIVRGVLLPATMKLLGERNWYLPRWLEWLPRLEGHEPRPRRTRSRCPLPHRPRRRTSGPRPAGGPIVTERTEGIRS